ncbi:uncharacterized protein LOC103995755 isoform X2 [Musa acuminata AAA Group]|uniref:uncharacterized protein LOC103995755 isoform X2 n=1 Tax=Musa acuminata AAA Group TaxID=214697 RepID=UPI0031D3B7F2
MWAVGGLNSGPAHMTPNQPTNVKEGSFDRSHPECSSGMAGDDQAEDARREAALACTPLFQPNFRPSKATQAQLDKLKELHKKRLQLKEKEEVTRLKGSSQRRGKICEEDTDVKNSTNSSASSADGSSSVSPLEQRIRELPLWCQIKEESYTGALMQRKDGKERQICDEDTSETV